MKKEIKLEYSFESRAEVLDRNSEKLREYETYFEEKILPEIKEIEKEKTESSLLRPAFSNQDIMGSNGSKGHDPVHEFECESIAFRYRTFPPTLRPLDLFHPERWMGHVFKKEG